MADKKIALALSALARVDEFVPLIDKAQDVFIVVLVGLAYRFGVMAVFLPLLFLLGKDSRILERNLLFVGSDYSLQWKRKKEVPNCWWFS